MVSSTNDTKCQDYHWPSRKPDNVRLALDFLKCKYVYVCVDEKRRKCQWLLSIMSLFIFNGVYWSLRSMVVCLCIS